MLPSQHGPLSHTRSNHEFHSCAKSPPILRENRQKILPPHTSPKSLGPLQFALFDLNRSPISSLGLHPNLRFFFCPYSTLANTIHRQEQDNHSHRLQESLRRAQ